MSRIAYARQGDVLLEEWDELPEHLEEVAPEENKIVLAHGEVTGHKHAIPFIPKNTMFVRDKETGNMFVIVINKPQALYHEEHKSIPLPDKKKGGYKVVRQRQYQYGEARRVED